MAVIQLKSHIGSAAAVPQLAAGEPAFIDPQLAVTDGTDGGSTLTVGTTVGGAAATRLLVGASRQVELAGAQTITGVKTIDIANLKITGGATGQGITTDGNGNLSFAAEAAGGLTAVVTDATLTGNGTAASPLSVAALSGGTF